SACPRFQFHPPKKSDEPENKGGVSARCQAHRGVRLGMGDAAFAIKKADATETSGVPSRRLTYQLVPRQGPRYDLVNLPLLLDEILCS
ncbi:MAG: hypothetical protein WCJ09_13170, partial [Planctomycetota bacterium]